MRTARTIGAAVSKQYGVYGIKKGSHEDIAAMRVYL